MLKNQVSIGMYAAMMGADRSKVEIKKPEFDYGKTKAKLAEFFQRNEDVRLLCEENKKEYPRMHQSVRATAFQLLMYYINKWGESVARNNEIRITHGYLKRAFNGSCCIATIKNHINKLLRMYKGFITEKYRGGLGLTNQNTACIVLVIDPEVLQFKNERDNEAQRVGKQSAEEYGRIQAEKEQKRRAAISRMAEKLKEASAGAEKRSQTPASFGQIFNNIFGTSPKTE